MRDIEFRAWDKRRKIMFTSMTDDGNPVAILNDKGIIPMQYTGLKDKNGKKIFEGDIVTRCGGEKYQGVYEYEDTVVVADTIDIVMLGEFQELEIIGNIHDNPELVKEN